MKKFFKWYIVAIVFFLGFAIIPFTLSKYSSVENEKLTVIARQPEYNVVFNGNAPTGTTISGSMSNMHFVYGTPQNLNLNAYTIDGFTFTGWSTHPEGSNSEFYADGELVNKLTDEDGATVTLYAQWRDYIAEMDGVYYSTLQAAVNAVPRNNTEKTIKLLWNTSESIQILSNKNITFDFQNYTISNNGSAQVIINNGTIRISNGTIRSSAGFAAIDNNQNAKLYMSGGRIIATGIRQCIYNDKGIVEISGDTYLISSIPKNVTDKERGTITNQAYSTTIIKGGTIISTTQNGVFNAGTLIIGEEDGNINKSTPTIQGDIYGIKTTNSVSYYNGTTKGHTLAINDVSKVTATETGTSIVTNFETIDEVEYQVAYLGERVEVTFDPNGGTVNEPTRYVEKDTAIGTLPVPNYPGYEFDGWFTGLNDDDDEITLDTIVAEDMTVYAHYHEVMVAEINGTKYSTLALAVNNVPKTNTPTTITLLRDTKENVTVVSGQNVIFDLQNYTITNDTNYSIITNNAGTVKVMNGNLISDSANSATINNNKNGHMEITGGNIIAIGQRQALYNDGGTVTISGTAYLCSEITASDKDRGTAHNLNNGVMNIIGGTIVSKTKIAVYNQGGTLTVGELDGNISTTSPLMQGGTFGIKSSPNFAYHDGIFKGITRGIDNESKANITESATITHGEELIDTDTYKTAYLVSN